ncbi:hypothetical protein [Metabacillus endolithicus]|uniref:Uncharacterized protein n=1 Tax=Metabacillus endolithicus TaxID=1535204 RepID=A0ABW5C348_9BACI|nr:hypothetical protein [Metabacillus endolithicus]UPG61664.1 hypothetical protein MVE64_13200 [Metabacillus endolithicus]
MKFKFFNDTGRIVTIHPATYEHGCYVDNRDAIMPLQRTLIYSAKPVPISSSNYGYGARNGLHLLISPIEE